ncbi:MAG: inorganic phosphate transporter [Clostridia bacterium]|nr:inorganic phosphate transporter [Clostridia bacterium]
MNGYAISILILVLMYTFYVGFNDGSTAIATTVVSRAIKPTTAIIVAAMTKFILPIGVFFIGTGSVATNIQDSLVFAESFQNVSPEKAFAFMLSGMLGAMIWAGIAFACKIPNTISHTLLGGIIGAAIAAFGFNAIQWKEYVLLNVVAMVLLAPLVGFVLGYAFLFIIKKFVRHAPRRMNKLLKIAQRVNLIVLTGAFSANNSQKSLGVLLLLSTLGLWDIGDKMPFWVVLVIAIALTLGMLFGGYRVMNTVGRKIFKIAPIHSVVSQLTTSLVSIAGTGLGISLGMGQVMTSSVIGVGSAERFNAVKWTTAGKITLGWCMTLPISIGAGYLMFMLIGKLIMGV